MLRRNGHLKHLLIMLSSLFGVQGCHHLRFVGRELDLTFSDAGSIEKLKPYFGGERG